MVQLHSIKEKIKNNFSKNNGKKFYSFMPIIAGIFLIALLSTSPTIIDNPTTSDDVQYDASVEVFYTDCSPTDPTDCLPTVLWDQDHNVLFGAGANATRDALRGLGSPINATTIALCNATAGCGTPVKAATEAYTQYSSCGLDIANGSVVDYGVEGNWSVTNTFTSSCTNTVTTNSTRLLGTTGTLFAGNTFTLASLEQNDQITVNWSIGVS